MVKISDLPIKSIHVLAISKAFLCLTITSDQFSQARGWTRDNLDSFVSFIADLRYPYREMMSLETNIKRF
jgi:hypothetical protein